MARKVLNYTISILSILILWLVLAKYIKAPLILPEPFLVFKQICSLAVTAGFWNAFLYTFLRVISAFLISIAAGIFLGFLCASSEFWKDFFELPLALIRTTPVIAVILTALFWFKSGTVPVFVAVLMTLPVVTTSVCTGLCMSEKELLFMAKVYSLSNKQILINIKIPNAVPFFLDAIENTFGLCWKVVVAGEVISLPKKALGSMMSEAQIHLETATVIAVTILLVILSFILQKIMKLFVEKIKCLLLK